MSTTSPAPPRLRQKRSEVTRRRILDAAVECLVEDGYAATSTLSIQQRANVSRGRLLHHFRSRDELLLAALDHLFEARQAALDERMKTAGTGRRRIDAALDLVWESFHDPLWLAASEMWIAARTNPHLARALAAHERQLGARIRQVLGEAMGPEVGDHPRFPQIWDQLTSSMRGVAMTYTFTRRDFRTDPHIPFWRTLVRQLLDGGK